jgi:hypothetical protein
MIYSLWRYMYGPYKVRPNRNSPTQLRKVGVEQVEGADRACAFSCLRCGSRWSPNLRPNGRLPRGYWKCPGCCNYALTETYSETCESSDD